MGKSIDSLILLAGIVTAGAGLYLLARNGVFDSILAKFNLPSFGIGTDNDFSLESKLTASEAAKAIKKAEKAAESGGDLFNTLSEGLADDEDVDKQLKALLER